MDTRVKEHISFYRRGVAYAAKREGGHITGDYDILKDETIEGTRTIVLKERDRKEFIQKVKELSKTLAEKLGEGESKTFIKILEDVFIDYEDEHLYKLHERVVQGKEPVKTREGCFRIIIGDGRKTSSAIIDIRD